MGEALGRFMACPACSQENELPYLLCDHCGEPRTRLNRWRVMCNISVAFTTLVASFHFRDNLWVDWNWPLYLLFALFFTQFTLFTAPVGWGKALRFNLWYAGFLGFFFGAYFLAHHGDLGIIFVGLNDFQDAVLSEPVRAAVIATGALIAFCGPTYYFWGKRYGWVNAYRIVLLSLGIGFGVILGALALLEPLIRWGILPEDLTGLNDFLRSSSRAVIQKWSTLLAANSLRIFVFEIAVFAAVRGLIVSKRSASSAKQQPADLAKENAFVRSAFHVAQAASRFLDALEKMVRYLLATLIILAKDMGQVLLAFTREILVPVVALSIASVLCHHMTFWFEAYVVQHQLDAFVKMSGGVLMLVTCALIFIGCKTNYRWQRVFGNLTSSIAWLLPNLLLFFLLLSFSLYASSQAMNKFTEEGPQLPFQVGILTWTVACFLLVLIGVMFYRKRSLLFSHPDEHHEEDGSPASSSKTEDLFEKEEGDAPDVVAPRQPAPLKKGVWSGMKRRVQSSQVAEAVKEKGEAFGLDTLKDRVFEIKRELQDWKSGMPPVVRDLENLRQQFTKKKSEMVALENTRESVSAEIYSELRTRYEAEYGELSAKVKVMQASLDDLFEKEKAEEELAIAQLGEVHSRQSEIDHLRTAGALSDKEARARLAETREEIRKIEAKIAMHKEWVKYMAPHATSNA